MTLPTPVSPEGIPDYQKEQKAVSCATTFVHQLSRRQYDHHIVHGYQCAMQIHS